MARFLCLITAAALMLDPGLGTTLHTRVLPIRMPHVQPTEPDTYLCYEKKIEDTAPIYITGFQPDGNMSIVHHILLYACKTPGKSNGKPWNCGEMHRESSQFDSGPVCGEGDSILYAWAMGAPELKLPEDVGFKVGGSTGLNSLVMQVHYKDVTPFVAPNKETDSSGVTLTITNKPQAKTAGVYIMMTGGEIPPHSVTYMETACKLEEPIRLHPFAYRVHTHSHGKVVSGYVVRDGKWAEIGRANPQKPQMFYPVVNKLDIEKGDTLAARCTMVNDDDSTVSIGSTAADEMCNFYMMYYVTGDHLLNISTCLSAGPPYSNWRSSMNLHGAPSTASELPAGDDGLVGDHEEQAAALRNEEMRYFLDKLFNEDDDLKSFEYFMQHSKPRGGWDENGEESQQPLFNEEDLGAFKSDMNMPAEMNDWQPNDESDAAVSYIDDKNGGKGYVKTHNSFNRLNDGPYGQGFVRTSQQEAGYHWSSDGATEE